MKSELKRYREALGLSQGELAECVGVTRQTINAIERDRYDPSLELAFKLAYFFEVRIHDLFIWEDYDDVRKP
ncbi:DNA-binding protein [Haladaptatus sp. R4]|uniref:helix-turn-helix transcriptional regulator n=1 Tax=Haladaptatus sp. R4 TaxID=1679489 RepID=UPI0007B49DED|nr:helix-turn-helix transcriptional regulator [Haladaptatus sp. R4]KZN25838.1 DNA-binding protein [Haladaptatus sp. R4]